MSKNNMTYKEYIEKTQAYIGIDTMPHCFVFNGLMHCFCKKHIVQYRYTYAKDVFKAERAANFYREYLMKKSV